MKVFISWSGETSKAVAEALRDWLPLVIQAIKEPFLSASDIDTGARWSTEITEKLKDTKVGIICLTRDNLQSPWVHFEAGALSKAVDDKTRVCPYLFGLETTDVGWPLAQFHAAKAEQEGTKNMLRAINKALGDQALTEKQLDSIFDTFWPQLKQKLDQVPLTTEKRQPVRTPEQEMLAEILQLVRGLATDVRPAPVWTFQDWGSGKSQLADLLVLGPEGPRLMEVKHHGGGTVAVKRPKRGAKTPK